MAAVDAAARRLGLSAGQKAADALALVPHLVTADHDPDADRRALESLCDWCVRFSPAVAVDGDDGLLLDITGADHLWGGEDAMLADLLQRLERWGVPARGAVADTAGAAWALARFGQGGAVVAPGGQREALARLPVAALRLDEAAQAQLPRLGLHRVGQLYALPRAQMAKRFGLAFTQRLDQALGAAGEALAFRRPASPWFERLAFFEPISAPDDLARVAADVLALICKRLEGEGRGARRFEVVFHRLDGKAFPVPVGLARPGRDARRLAKLVAPKLDVVDPGFGIDVITVHAYAVEALAQGQSRIDAELDAAEALAPLVDRLVNRLGEGRVWRPDPVESHVPERAVARAAPLASPAAARPWNPDLPRPTRLLKRPEPIEVLAKLPDDPPLRFTWRNRHHRVRAAEGPERIGQEWWRGDFDDTGPGRIRDYYRVEDEAGGRFWIYRQGLYGDDASPKWWLHGLFG
ncbi:DNA polymerase Y family protein [Caulobacter flavus]|uniref:DNA polymerase Y family protein n=1 Tax=Caulobacter flavus TaxID=1679497 RepID=UPI001F0C5BFF|nr:DNA polymerase Y family protein [Caulobacter flavus]